MKKWTSKALLVVLCVLTLVFAASCGTTNTATDTSASTGQASAAATEAASEAASSDTETIKVGISLGAISSTFNEGLRDGAIAKITELGGEPVYVCADGDATLQATQIEDLVSQGCKAIICFANDTDAIETTAQYCNENDVLFVEASRISPDLTYVDLALGFDNKQQAEICGQAILDCASEIGYTELKCIEFIGSLTDQNAIERRDYFEAFAAENGIEVVATVLTEWDAELAYSRFKDAITACGGDYNCIYSASDFLYTTIMSVLNENAQWVQKGEEGYKIITGIDGAPDALQKIRDGYVYMVANTDVLELGRQTAEKTWDMLVNGTTYTDDNKTVIIDAQTITAENCDDPEIWGNIYQSAE